LVSNWTSRRGPERDLERRGRQIRELVRLSNTLHADLGLQEILTQLANAVSTTIGFGIAAFNLVREGSDRMEIAAIAGMVPSEYQRLVESPPRLQDLERLMRAEFCRSRSYYISHEYVHLLEGIETVAVLPPPPPGAQRPPDAWHPDDMLLVPLISPRSEHILGLLSLDQPEDCRVPTLETIEMVELFANQAAIAIDMARLFEERERERRSLDEGLYQLLGHMSEVGRGNLAVHAELDGTALSQIGKSLNTVLSKLSGVLGHVRHASAVVSRSAADVQAAANQLASSAQEQAQQILDVSGAVAEMAEGVRRISSTASSASTVAQEASEISHVGREAAERAAQGMTAVREMTLQSAKRIKRLGESTQEVGEIVQMVSDFANQTNLLALNAAIEAARAGEHGRGFNVVAQEIRNLATNSAEATQAIHARIKGIQNDTNAVVVTIEEGTRQVVIQSDLAAQAGAALGAVDAVTQRIAGSIGDISQTAEQHAHASTKIATSMENIAQITAQTRDSMEHMRSSMERLADLAGFLQQSISIFRLGQAYTPEITGHLTTDEGAAFMLPGLRSPVLLGDAAAGGDETTQPTMPIVPAPPGVMGGSVAGFSGLRVGTQPDWASSSAPLRARATTDLYAGAPHPGALDGPSDESDIPPPPPGFDDWNKR
jgi:methyl-accepting chemotaxis protein